MVNMKINDVLSELYSFGTKDLVPLTKIVNDSDKERAGYIIEYSLSEWEHDYPELPAEHIFYAPVLVSANMIYFDKNKYIWLNIPIFGKEVFFGEKSSFLKQFQAGIEKAEKAYEERNYIQLFNAMPDSLRMELICQMPQKNESADAFYSTFKNFYPASTCFTNRFPEGLSQQLIESKTIDQIMETRKRIKDLPRKNGKIIVYRGMADKSANADKAISWTTDINVAYFFAMRAGYYPKILTGYIDDNDVVEYFSPEEKAETEIIVIPGKVQNVSRKKLLDTNSSEINAAVFKINKTYQSYKNKIISLYNKFPKGLSSHENLHTLRVLLYTLIISELSQTSKDIMIMAADAAVYHDIGRNTDGIEPNHGVMSKKIYEENNPINEIVSFAIEYHCESDEEVKQAAQKRFENPNTVLRVLEILKDADALDRLRFGYYFQSNDSLDVKQLRLEASKKIVPFANQAIKNIKF